MKLQGKAYFNAVRMDWVDNPMQDRAPWQVEDYRSLALDTLFEKLEDLGLQIDKDMFMHIAGEVDSPEELTKALLAPDHADAEEQVYLVAFELWRRLLPERLSLSVFCDEMDSLIFKYNKDSTGNTEAVEDMLAHLQMFLDENCDDGINPKEAFATVQSFCANDLESFLYDYISDEMEGGNEVYAAEVIEGFSTYLPQSKWFAILEARKAALQSSPEEAAQAVKRLLKQLKDPDIAFYFEVLIFLVSYGDEESFKVVVKKTLPLLEVDEDFAQLLSECADFYHRMDREEIEAAVTAILKKRAGKNAEERIKQNDPDLITLLKLLS